MAEIGYTVFEPWRQRGIAGEALAAMLRFASGNGADQAVLSIAPDNLPSLRLAGYAELARAILGDEVVTRDLERANSISRAKAASRWPWSVSCSWRPCLT